MIEFVAKEKTKKELAPVYQAYQPSPWGTILLKANSYGLCGLGLSTVVESDNSFNECEAGRLNQASNQVEIGAAKQHVLNAKNQLEEYFAQQRSVFALKLAPFGTVFQRQVWQALIEVSYGNNCSYADIANGINNPKAVRAVGAANGANPIAIVVPCHRVIGKNGSMTGYAYGINMKQGLLRLEQSATLV